MSEKWKRVADTLAGRLMYHESCNHYLFVEGCPFCDDEAAMKIYRKAGGNIGIPATTGKMIPIQDLKFSARKEPE
jgi:hypothetical protein